jgi:putative component of membrane protein insertase Oxa1/YidC/SpoIIIJ protein YidD
MRGLLLALIGLYRRRLSPHKGFSCAYRAHTGRASCSALGWRAVRRFGALKGLAMIRARTQRCGVAHRRYGPAWRRVQAAQRGDCDCGALPCDGPGGGRGCGLGLFSCCDIGSCDWPERKRHRRDPRGDASVHLPPKRR